MKDHPYKQFENTNNWKLIEKGIQDLIKNNDIEILTQKEYIIGYFCKVLEKNDNASTE